MSFTIGVDHQIKVNWSWQVLLVQHGHDMLRYIKRVAGRDVSQLSNKRDAVSLSLSLITSNNPRAVERDVMEYLLFFSFLEACHQLYP